MRPDLAPRQHTAQKARQHSASAELGDYSSSRPTGVQIHPQLIDGTQQREKTAPDRSFAQWHLSEVFVKPAWVCAGLAINSTHAGNLELGSESVMLKIDPFI